MAVQKILQLGDPALYEITEEVQESEMHRYRMVIADMHDTVMDFRLKHGFGRAIAAPQIGINKRLVYMFINEPRVFVNPVLSDFDRQMLTIWDNCLSFPFLSVKVKRHAACTIDYFDIKWSRKSERLEGELSELLQHEVDHLDGILAIQRAVDTKAFAVRGHEQYDK
ncbi:MAG: peptide deformylase [Candidatus Zixiibacteriota bacterium]|nr:MAG: peptide deformylase [candidate division Zixibacteria bacterium]